MSFQVLDGGNGMPPEPDWSALFNDPLDMETAHETWSFVVREMQSQGTLAFANVHAVKRLVSFAVHYERSARHVAENGPVLRGKRAKVGQWNPHWSVMRQADEVMRALEATLGIDPIRRGRTTRIKATAKKALPSDAYLGKATG